MIYFAWYFVNSLEIKNGKQLMKRNTRIIVLKLKIKMSRCCIIHTTDMPTLERLKAVGGLGFATPSPQKFFFQKDAKWCILLHFGYKICSVKSLNIVWKNMKKWKLTFYIYTSQTSVPRTRMGRIPWMARTYLKVPPIFHIFLS